MIMTLESGSGGGAAAINDVAAVSTSLHRWIIPHRGMFARINEAPQPQPKLARRKTQG